MADKIALLGSWDAVMISSVRLEKYKPLEGKNFADRATFAEPHQYPRTASRGSS